MEKIIIEVEKGGNMPAKEARKEKRIPMIYYGRGVEPVQLSADYQEFRKAYLKGGRSSIFTLKGAGKDMDVLVHEVQYHPTTDEIMHVDFMVVKQNEKLHTEVPLTFTGEAPAVKEMGGTFVVNKDRIEIECLPKDLVHDIQVDISSLKDFHSSITVGDLILPHGIKAMDAPEISVATVAAPQKEEEVTPAPAPAAEGAAAEGEAKEGDKEKKE